MQKYIITVDSEQQGAVEEHINQIKTLYRLSDPGIVKTEQGLVVTLSKYERLCLNLSFRDLVLSRLPGSHR